MVDLAASGRALPQYLSCGITQNIARESELLAVHVPRSEDCCSWSYDVLLLDDIRLAWLLISSQGCEFGRVAMS